MNGVVKKVINSRSFGFINGEDGVEYFFHRDDFFGHWNDLEVDVDSRRKIEVEFEKGESRVGKGPRAAKVRRIEFPDEGPSILGDENA